MFNSEFLSAPKHTAAENTCVADPDPGTSAFLTPGSGIRDKHLGSYLREPNINFFGFQKKIFNFFFLFKRSGSGMESPDPGSGLEKDLGSRCRDKDPGSTTLEIHKL
jgi:hypothetical protein